MRELVCVVLLCVTLVHSATIFRSDREIIEPIVDEFLKEEVIAELKAENIPVAIESEPILTEVKEEAIIPNESSRNVEPAVKVEEPVAVVSEPKDAVKAVLVEETIVPELKAAEPVFIEVVESVKNLNNEPALVAVAEEIIVPVQVENKVESLLVAEPVQSIKSTDDTENVVNDEPIIPVMTGLRQEAVITQRPSVFMQVSNAIMSSPIVTALNNIRPGANRPQTAAADTPADASSDTAEEGSAAPAAPSTPVSGAQNPIQQFIVSPIQQGFQAVTNALGIAQNSATSAINSPAGTTITTAPQNILQSLQQGVTNLFQPISNLIRPQGNSAVKPEADQSAVDAKLDENEMAAGNEFVDNESAPVAALAGNGPIETIVGTLSDLIDRDSSTLKSIPLDAGDSVEAAEPAEKSVEPIVEKIIAEPVAAVVSPVEEIIEPVKPAVVA